MSVASTLIFAVEVAGPGAAHVQVRTAEARPVHPGTGEYVVPPFVEKYTEDEATEVSSDAVQRTMKGVTVNAFSPAIGSTTVTVGGMFSTPVPVSVTAAGEASDVICSEPVRVPMAVGVNCTWIVQIAAILRVAPQLFV